MKQISLSICLIFQIAYVANSQTITISVNSNTYQTIEGIGGGIVYYQNWVTAHPNKQAIYDTVFTGLGLSGLRIGNWAQETNVDLKNDIEILNKAKELLGNNFFIQMSSWSAPASLKANGKINGSQGGIKASLKKENDVFVYDQFGAWWKQALETYHAAGIYPDYISLQNEPDMDADYEATLFNPTESTDIASYGKALVAVSNAIKGMPNKPKMLGPEPLGVGWNTTQNYVNQLDKTLLDGYCFHYYHSGVNGGDRYSNPDDFLTAMTGLKNDLGDKPMFMTENCSMRAHADEDALYLAWLMANSFNVNRVSSYLFWDLMWGSDGGCIALENPWGTFTTTNGFIVQPEYHGLRHFSKFIKQGWKCVGVSSTNSDVVTAAFKSPQSDAYTVVIINKSTNNHTAGVSLPAGAPNKGTVVQSIPSSKQWSKVNGTFTLGNSLSIPARSITTIAFYADNSTAPIVTLTAPVSTSEYVAPATITLSATATDINGTITKVDFYNGTQRLVEKYIYPYTWNWTNVPAGKYTITAVAFDNDGNQTTSTAVEVGVQGAYGGTPHPIPGKIEFENYDVGGNGVAYFDDSPGSAVTPIVNYRTDEDVDIENCSDAGGGYSIGYATAGEWLEYTVNVATTGSYNIILRVACNAGGRTISLQAKGTTIASNVAIPNTAGWQTWADVAINNVNLTAGVQIIRITIGASDYVNLNCMTFAANSTTAPTVTTPVTYCQGATATALTATGTALKWYTVATGGASTTTAPVPSTTTVGSTTYYVTQTLNTIESSRVAIVVTVNATPVAPTVTTPVTYCKNATATALTATATVLKWYTAATGGTSSGTAPTPTTTAAGSTTYYVSQTVNTCESPRAAIVVTVNAIPTITPYIQVNAEGWNAIPTVTVIEGNTVAFGPWPTAAGWSWIGPNGFTSNIRSQTISNIALIHGGTYTATYTDANGCTATQNYTVTVLKRQTINLVKGWNLISTNVYPADSSISTLFSGLDVQEIKSMDAFWRKGQDVAFNSLKTITAGKGYLLNMNAAGTLSITGTPFLFSNFQINSFSNFQMIGCPYQIATPLSNFFSASNCEIIKNFEGYWTPNGTTNSIQNFEPGKAYYLLK